jgi:hypothetical protein
MRSNNGWHSSELLLTSSLASRICRAIAVKYTTAFPIVCSILSSLLPSYYYLLYASHSLCTFLNKPYYSILINIPMIGFLVRVNHEQHLLSQHWTNFVGRVAYYPVDQLSLPLLPTTTVTEFICRGESNSVLRLIVYRAGGSLTLSFSIKTPGSHSKHGVSLVEVQYVLIYCNICTAVFCSSIHFSDLHI